MSENLRLYCSPQSCVSVAESTSSALRISVAPRCRMRPVTTARALTSLAISLGSMSFPLYRNTTERATTRSPAIPASLFMMLSVMPSPRYSLSASPPLALNGSTASESIAERAGGVVRMGDVTPTLDGRGLGALTADCREKMGVETGGGDTVAGGVGGELAAAVLAKTDRRRPHSPSLAGGPATDVLVSAWANAAADANLPSGLFAIAFSIARLTYSGTSGRAMRTFGTGSRE